MGLEVLQKYPNLAKLMLPLWLWDAKQKFQKLEPFLQANSRILELGSGLGSVTYYFRQQGLDITPLDIKNLSLLPDTVPLLYDGIIIPFQDNNFDIVLLLTVLHHTSNPRSILQEASRVAQKIIIIEDIYHNNFQKYLTYGVDSLINFEFREHPHNNQTDTQWQQMFDDLNLIMVYTFSYPLLYLFRQVIYVLKK